MEIRNYLKTRESLIEENLRKYFKNRGISSKKLMHLMQYSLLSGGKRIRSILVLAVANLFNRKEEKFLPCATAMEMVHTSSLILDDLPCMDDALLRRGKPALHRIYGEAEAILASYALLMEGIRLIAKDIKNFGLNSEQSHRVVEIITDSVGLKGISLGQFWDLELTHKKFSQKDIEKIHFYKTTSLFIACVEIPAILIKARKEEITALKKYGRNLGSAFQIKDDILGVEKGAAELGKYSLKGEIRPNYVHLVGIMNAKKRLCSLIQGACASLSIFGKRAHILCEIAKFIGERRK